MPGTIIMGTPISIGGYILNDSEIKSASTTVFQILPQPANPGFSYFLVRARVSVDATQGVYGNVFADCSVYLSFGGFQMTEAFQPATAFTNKQVSIFEIAASSQLYGGPTIMYENLPLNMVFSNGGQGAFTGGGPGNTMKVVVLFTELSTGRAGAPVSTH